MNCVQLTGRLTKNPDLRFAPSTGKAVTRFTIAVRKKFKDAEGNYGANFINCIAWGKQAEIIAEKFIKGKEIAVVGSLNTGSYEDKQGVKRYTTDVYIDSFDFIGSNTNANTSETHDSGFGNKEMADNMMPIDEGDMPF